VSHVAQRASTQATEEQVVQPPTRRRGALAAVAAAVGAGMLAIAGLATFDRAHVLVIGDSISGQYGPTVVQRLREEGYDATVRAYPGVGLLDRGPRLNIDPMIQTDLHQTDPDVVVAEFSGNYGLANPPAPGVPLASPAYFTAWTQAVQAFDRAVSGRGARLIWVIPPRPLHNRGPAEQLAATYASQRRPGIDVLDTGPAALAREADEDLHAPDGAHLNAAGAAFVAGLAAGRVRTDSAWSVRIRTLHGPALIAVTVIGVLLIIGGVVALRKPDPS
jgi:hypothetical protein